MFFAARHLLREVHHGHGHDEHPQQRGRRERPRARALQVREDTPGHLHPVDQQSSHAIDFRLVDFESSVVLIDPWLAHLS
jgi:hypothetical protein